MTVADLIKELLKVEDKTKEICTFQDHTMHEVIEVDELSDRVDLNLGGKIWLRSKQHDNYKHKPVENKSTQFTGFGL